MRRGLDHIDAYREASDAGFAAVVMKDHYYCTAPIARLLARKFPQRSTVMLGGIVLNSAVGGLNPFAVEHALDHGARIVWLPTLDAENHQRSQIGIPSEQAFPRPRPGALPAQAVSLFEASGEIRQELKTILDLVAAKDAVLSAGHVHVDEAFQIFEEARRHGVKRFVLSHPSFVLGASLQDIRRLAEWGVVIEHSICMWFGGADDRLYNGVDLLKFIEAGTVERTIFGSDLGQFGNCSPVEGFRRMAELLDEVGLSDKEIKAMLGGNALALLDSAAANAEL
jgi:hypothetical protein